MTRIFISYRREDSGASAGRLYDRLEERYGRDNVFMDIATIEPGLDFVDVIERTVASCDVLIALIGRQWLTSTDAAGQRRLDDPKDFVRREIATALRRNIRVIPALVQNTSMPRAANLPDDLQLLAQRNAVELSDAHFNRDVGQLIEVLDRVLPPVRPSYLRSWKFLGLACLIFAGMASIVALYVVPLVKMPIPEIGSPSPSTEEKEPNDDIGSATLITEGTTVRGSIATPQDRDLFAFAASSPKTRVILRKQFHAGVDVYDHVEQQVASGVEVRDRTISLSFESTPGLTYYIVVKPFLSARGGDYQLVVRKE